MNRRSLRQALGDGMMNRSKIASFATAVAAGFILLIAVDGAQSKDLQGRDKLGNTAQSKDLQSQDKLGNFKIQGLMSEFNESERKDVVSGPRMRPGAINRPATREER